MIDCQALLARKQRLRTLFTEMLGALGRKEFEIFAPYVAEDACFEWPYSPLKDWRGTMQGRDAFIRAALVGMADSNPYAYTIEAIHDILDPDTLIAEYTSHSFYHPRGLPYSNKYISLLLYEGERVVFWKEYVNPLIIRETYGEDFFNLPASIGQSDNMETRA